MSSNIEFPCEHIKSLWKYCKDNSVYFEGCDCSGYVFCEKCNISGSNSE